MAADCKSADSSLRGCESLPAHIFIILSLRIYDILAIEFYDGYISIVVESNLSLYEEIKKFVEDSEEACSIRMPAIVLDMKNVKEINSAGIAKILKLYKDLQSLKIRLFMMNISETIAPIFKDLMMFTLIKTFDNKKDFLLQ